MSDYSVRFLRPDEHRAASDLFRATLHVAAPSDDEWERSQHAYQPGRTLGVFDTGLIGTARSIDAELTVPGGKRVPVAAVTGVGVRADRTRRGVLTAMMGTQLRDLAARGVPLAALYATEGAIYGRYGYGPATRTRGYRVDRRRAVLRDEVPAGGEIELLTLEPALERLPGIYAALPHTAPGMMTRPPYWWPGFERHARRSTTPISTAVHHGPDGPDGFVVYTVVRSHSEDPDTLDVLSLHSASSEAFAGLWRFLLGVDLVDTISAADRPLDEPTELLFTDPTRCRPAAGHDHSTWLRLVDVEAALAAREYQGDPVVIEVSDPVLEANSGRYRVSPEGVVPTGEPAGLRLGVDALAMLYLGTWRASALAGTGLVQPVEPKAVAAADELFRTDVSAWCGTFF
ncbi:GNAT family N-acetyltransferase [Amycolatopsis taiwanensis]|uniref:GNAT family N-acetyltransferase n=1 Tax=Amycolatopsis taiwanensis TaxID=342230 RepID=UPI00047FE0C6|nr:GNAT family N-acetyltransferase [Amycolatopsis taiwanensis]